MTEQRSDYLTASQRATLEAELAELEGPRRARAVQAIKTAREHGDLSENFEYQAAKNEKGLLEARIRTLPARLLNAITIDESELVEGAVAAGSIVELELEAGERMEVEVSSVGGPGTVSPESPLGRALAGHRAGDEVAVEAPGGAWSARIRSVRCG